MADPTPDRLTAAVHPLADALLVYVHAAREHSADVLDPAVYSPAARDREVEADVTEPMWETPVIHVDSIGTVALHGALDHARMYATALAHMVPPPIWAHRSYLRPILEMSRDSMWLFDPAAAVEDRIKRSLKLESASARRYQEAAEALGPALDMKRRIHRIEAYARTRKWSLGTVKIPRLAEHVDLVCGDLPGSLGGIALYHQLSATLHGDMWALVQALEVIDADLDTGHRLGGLVISGERVVQSLAFAGASIDAATRTRLAYYGIDPPDPLVEAYREFGRLWLIRWHDMEARGVV